MGGQLFSGEEIHGKVVGVYYRNEGSGFGVVEVEQEGGGGARCVGPLAELVEDQTLRLVGRWTSHPVHGESFEVSYYEQTTPTTVGGLRDFLTSDRFADLDQQTIERVLAAFGDETGRVIAADDGRLESEAGLSADRARTLVERWREGTALAELVRLVEPAGLAYGIVRGAFSRFGANAPEIVRANPYALLEVERCRFAQADRLAEHLGIEALDTRRLVAGAVATHAAARRRDGHQYLTVEQTVQGAAALLRVERPAVRTGLERAVSAGELTIDDELGAAAADPGPGTSGSAAVYSPAGLAAERDLAADVARLLGAHSTRLRPHGDEVELSDELTSGQEDAVRLVFQAPVTLLTGGPGTGKTRTVQEVVAAAAEQRLNVALCAPTGRAAKRLEELVGLPASTVHRLLEAKPTYDDEESDGGFTFTYGTHNRLPHDLVVCDEFSMCDTWLASRLLSAVDDGAHVLLVGDPDQLPPVGPGDVLRDLLRSGVVPGVTLTEIHRQAAESRIVGLARDLNDGDLQPPRGVDGDVFMAEEPVRTRIVPRVVEAVSNRIPDYFAVAVEDVQVVAPVYRGPAGVDALNEALKAALNPAGGRPAVAGFHAGDRVMQTRNDTELDVSNGDVGHVVDVDPGRKRLRVAFPRGEVTYKAHRARDLTLAWAITVHKSQGGEWPVVVFVCDRSHSGMLWRNLAYTAVTRAQRALVVVGQGAALSAAAAHDRPRNRQTLLAARLEKALATTGSRAGVDVEAGTDKEVGAA